MKILTILIPCFNCAKTINRTIDSFDLKKYGEKIDVLLIDDGSTDNTYEVLKKIQNKFKNSIRIYKKKNGNYGSVMNFAKNKINSKFVKTCDANDTFETKNLNRFLHELENMEEKVDIVFTNFNFINNNSLKKTKNSLTTEFQLTQKNFIKKFSKFKKNNIGFLTIHAITSRKEIFQSINNLPERIFYTDSCLLFELFSKSRYFCYIPHLYIYNYYVCNSEQSINIKNMVARKEQVDKVFLFLINNFNKCDLQKKHNTWLISIIRMVINFLFLIISFNDISNYEKKVEMKKQIEIIFDNINKKRSSSKIINFQLWLMINMEKNIIFSLIRFFYYLGIVKFSRATKGFKGRKHHA